MCIKASRKFLFVALLTGWMISRSLWMGEDTSFVAAAPPDSTIRQTAEQAYAVTDRAVRRERMFRLLIGLAAGGIVLSIVMWRRIHGSLRRELSKSKDILRPAVLYDIQRVSGQFVFTICKPMVSIGRAAEDGSSGVDIALPVTNLAALQAVLEYKAGTFYLVNYNEGVAVTVNGVVVRNEIRLQSGDQICIAGRPFRFLVPGAKDYAAQRRQYISSRKAEEQT